MLSRFALFYICFVLPVSAACLADEVDFAREVLPLLSDNCFQCHGPDAANREADLRLDQQEGAFAAIKPGDSAASDLFARISSNDEGVVMPPPDSGKSMSADEIAKIKGWIDQGAAWSKHWAFESPKKPVVPELNKGWSANNAIDHFIQSRVAELGMEPETRANKETLIRRVTLDLTGLPPTIDEIDHFLADDSPQAFERVVDRLLDSQQYGEHMARIWLDAARYADTHGLHLDNERSIWPYRDWVIDAFNRNMPFDDFTIQQLAGDLLPEPSLDQRVATGFNRCNVTTGEGGSIDDEYYVRYAVERVETTSTVWLGLTAGCAACHDHKFDPLTQKEFYQLFSYFFSLTEKAMDGNQLLPPPSIKVPSADQKSKQEEYTQILASLNKRIAGIQAKVKYTDPTPDAKLGKLDSADHVWFDDELPKGAKPAGDGPYQWNFVKAPEYPVFSGENASLRTGKGLTQHFFSDANPKLTIGNPGKLFAYVYLDPKDPPETIQLQFNDGNWNHRAYWGADKAHGAGGKGPSNHRMGDLPELGKWIRLEVDASLVGLKPESQLNGWAYTQYGGTVLWDKGGVVSMAPLSDDKLVSLQLWEQYRKEVKSPALPADIQKILGTELAKRNENQKKKLTEYFVRNVHPKHKLEFVKLLEEQSDTQKKQQELDKTIPATLVMQDRDKPRQAHVLERGEYTKKGEAVESAVPSWLASLPKNVPNNRLGLAKWLVDPSHPLTARVTVNRFWQHFFGTGIVKTSEDFGVQGAQPSHPELLDWMAVRFVESGWDVKQFQKLIIMSSTYQQSSRVASSKLAIDPENRMLARGPRFRLDAEVIRDSALAVSGLLVRTVGGKSVKPYQPAGLWKPVGFGGSNTSVFKQDSGEKLYRRSMYTFWKRTSPPPSMSTFDAPDRETCQVRRARTNTPLQALVLMNDVQFVESARKFAERTLTGGNSDAERIQFAFRSVTGRRAKADEIKLLTEMKNEYLEELKSNPDQATKLISVGESARDESIDPAELAAWTMVGHLILNLSETVTRG